MQRFLNPLFTALRKNPYRRGPQRLLGGVLGGFAELTGFDATWVRIGFLVFCLLPGPAILLYLLLWLLLPEHSSGQIVLEKFLNRTGNTRITKSK
ncbi:PspC domain-containing protein [Acaricomes phytoseiuli]|uniref:PspC domain-containing protein n=1 Tax=Acaricomes phytoseiuli TaxID=291968 RepID=UPI00036355B4|nr:PspC domain-containing protein [Acaricomes phytoseiuli]MCW1249754.1 PspC domain-containing protein [Acaricomes phytoseiuli]